MHCTFFNLIFQLDKVVNIVPLGLSNKIQLPIFLSYKKSKKATFSPIKVNMHLLLL